MIRKLLHRTISKFERHYDYDATYMHEIANTSVTAFLKLALAQALSAHRDGVPSDALFAARIAAARFEDCGPCAQLVVNMALEAGVAPAVVRAIVARDDAAVTDDVRLSLALADAVLTHAASDGARDDVLQRWGQRGLVTLAYAIAGTRIYPTMKRVLGHAHTCERLRVDGESVMAARAAA
jgi:alkylhydroperoxidase family enzyme